VALNCVEADGDSISSTVMDKVLAVVGTWKTPALVGIQDARLGVLSNLLKFCVLLYGLLMLFLNTSYHDTSIPGGFPTVWFESGEMPSEQIKAQPYCGNADYYWNYTENAGWWDEYDINCVAPDYGDTFEIASRDVMLYTYQKLTSIRHFPCDPSTASGSACALASMSGSRPCVDSVRTLESTNETVCSCAFQQDSFLMGVDKMQLKVQHSFSGDASTSYVKGSSTLTSSSLEGDDRLIKTCVKKLDASDEICDAAPLPNDDKVWDKCCTKVFEPGETLGMSIEEWLSAGGAILDERLPNDAGLDPFTNKPPMRRVAGTKLQFKFRYYGIVSGMFGNSGEQEIRCELSVENQEGWTSAGSKVQHSDFQGYTNTKVNDMYKRGIRFQFFSEGLLRAFSWSAIINTLVSALVFLGLADGIVALVAFSVVKEKDVYKRAQTQTLDYGNELAAFGIRSAIACEAFKSWNNGFSGPGETLSQEEFAAIYEQGGFKKERAAKFSSVVLNRAAADVAQGMTCKELIEVLGGGLVSMQNLEDYADKQLGPDSDRTSRLSSVKIAPSPAEGSEGTRDTFSK